jgi:hypothetical protein
MARDDRQEPAKSWASRRSTSWARRDCAAVVSIRPFGVDLPGPHRFANPLEPELEPSVVRRRGSIVAIHPVLSCLYCHGQPDLVARPGSASSSGF